MLHAYNTARPKQRIETKFDAIDGARTQAQRMASGRAEVAVLKGAHADIAWIGPDAVDPLDRRAM